MLVVQNLPVSAGDVKDMGSSPGLGRPPGGGHGNPLQYSCLANAMDRGAWRAYRVPKSWTQLKQLSTPMVAVVTTPSLRFGSCRMGPRRTLPVWAPYSELSAWGCKLRSFPRWSLTIWVGNKQELPQKGLPQALLCYLVPPRPRPCGPAPRFPSRSWVDKVQWG